MPFSALLCAELVPFGYINGTSWKSHPSSPLLSRPLNMTGSGQWREDQLVVRTHSSEPVVVEVIINNHDADPHPFHLVRVVPVKRHSIGDH
jgi:hypothetical protein